jgi:hypothetical protein
VNVNPTLRGFGILVVLAAAITAFQLRIGLEIILVFLQIFFLLAIAYVLFLLWRNRRHEISLWSRRSQIVFYGGAALALADVGLAFTSWFPTGGVESLIFLLALAAGIFSMWRVWRDEHTYGY